MDDVAGELAIGFALETGTAFAELLRFSQMFDDKTVEIVRRVAAVEKATGGMMQLGPAKASITSYANAATRELQSVAREKAQTERAGEALIKQLEREAASLGKTRDQMREAKVEAIALAAAEQNNTDLADRLLAASRQRRIAADNAAEAEQRAAAQAVAAKNAQVAAIERVARQHADLAAKVRGSHAAQEADAVAAERLRMSTDPLYAATKRLNDEIAESTRLYHAGATAKSEYERQQDVLTGRLRVVQQQFAGVNSGFGSVGASGQLAGHHMQNLAFQFQDIGVQMFAAANSSQPLKMAFMALMQQGAQIQMIMSQAGVGIRAVGAAFLTMSKSILIATATNPYLLAGAAAIAAFAGGVKLLQNAANSSVDMKKYAESLGLTAKEIRNLDNVTVTFGDTAKAVFQVAGRAIWSAIGPAVTSVWDLLKSYYSWAFTETKKVVNFMIGGFVGAYNNIRSSWSKFPAVLSDIFYTAVNNSIDAINAMVKASVDGLNLLIGQANKVLPAFMQLPELTAGQLARVKNEHEGAAAAASKIWTKEMRRAMGVDYVGQFGSAVIDQAVKNAHDRVRKQAEEKGYLDPEKPKTDKHAERLAREAQAVEAQIRNLYKLADAYKVSGAAALIAEARVKAESEAIKKRADIEAMVDRQVRLAIAQRVSDAAKATASVREQADAQKKINDMVAAGLIPAERAADLVRDQIADLPLLAAIQAAQQRGLTDEAKRATRALVDQRVERERLAAEERRRQFQEATSAGADHLAELREELRLIGATDQARIRALATLRATQEAQKFNPEDRAAYVKQQVDIADAQYRLGIETNRVNEELRLTADRADATADAMSRAFGRVGSAIGDVISILGRYGEEQERIDAQIRAGTLKQAEGAKLSGDLQMHSLIGITGAAKNLFKEHSRGYQAMAAAEKALTIIQLARTAVDVAGGAARMFAALGPFAFPAVAAMLGVMASLGFRGGSGAGSKPPETNTGTGTVFGDTAAKSESIKRAIDSLKEVDTLTNTYAREMAGSLRSIESQIGGFAALIVRAGDINASAGVNTGFEADLLGKTLGKLPFAFLGPLGVAFSGVIKKIPIIGDILGGIGGVMQSLFGSKKTVVGSGLFGGPQSLGSILNGGFDAQYFSDIQKKKKFFGITTGTSYSTKFGAADPTLENQFTLILRSFNDAIAAAAGPLGASTSDIEARLRGFVVNIGKIDLKGLTGEQIEEKLEAIFGAAADNMASAAFPSITRFQKVGEGAFETLVRVASTVEAVTNSLGMLGDSARNLGIDAKMGLAGQFASIGQLTSAVDNYFEKFFSKEEQAAARTAEMTRVFGSLGLTMPPTLAAFRALVEAQDLTTAAGQKTYATLLQLAPAFADLQTALSGAKSAAEILSERQDLERRLLELLGKTAEIRALDLAKLDPSNRALQQQIWAIEDAKEAARAAEDLRKAWTSVGDSIMDEVKRIRGLTGADNGGGFAMLMGQFNAATNLARTGDQEAAKSLPGLSQALLTAAAQAATSRQELDRLRAQTAASLEATYSAISASTGNVPAGASISDIVAAAAATQAASAPPAANDDLVAEVRSLREEVTRLRNENNSGHAATASNTGSMKRTLDNVTQASGGDAVSVAAA